MAVGPPPTRTEMSAGMLGAPEVVAISPVRADIRFSLDGILPSLRRASHAADQSADDVACTGSQVSWRRLANRLTPFYLP